MQLKECAVLVTGAASGLGEATARHFASTGAQVAVLDRDTSRGSDVASEIGGLFIETDVTSETSVRNAVSTARTTLGRITVAVNCAGIADAAKTVGRDGAHSFEMFQRTIDINLTGTFNVARLAAEAIQANPPDAGGMRGVIINTASIAAFDGQKGQTAYAASKGGVAGLCLPMARDLASLGIRVMTIAPGIFMTPMLAGLPQEVQDQLAADVPCPPRLGDPAEYARLAGFIVENDYLNGEVIRIDGALRMR